MRRLLPVLLCAVLSLGGGYDDLLRQLGWDDRYVVALESIEQHYGKEIAQRKLQAIRLAGVTFEQNPARDEVRQALTTIGGKVLSSIRLEHGNANMGSVAVVWFLETSSGPVLLKSDAKSFCRRDLKTEDYSELMNFLEAEKVWDIISDADDELDDGSVYFLSVSRNGRAHQAVIYGPPSYGLSAEQRGLTPSADRFVRIIDKLLARSCLAKR